MTVHIMIGSPGCGKSKLAQELCNPENMDAIFSADDFFCQKGKYEFDASKLNQVHGRCLRSFTAEVHTAGFDGREFSPNFIVDNTNSTLVEIAPYYALAQAYGHSVVIHRFLANRHEVEHIYHPRNVHEVPLQVCMAIAQRVWDLKFPPFWQFQLIDRGMKKYEG